MIQSPFCYLVNVLCFHLKLFPSRMHQDRNQFFFYQNFCIRIKVHNLFAINAMISEEQARVEGEIAQIEQNKFLSESEKVARVSQIRKNSRAQGIQTSFKTITSLANTMIGSAIIIYPVLFIKDGMIGSMITVLIIGIVQFLTCRLLVIHNRTDEASFNDSIKRIGGVRLWRINMAVNVTLLFFVCIAYFILVVSNFFQVTVSIIQSYKDFTPPSPTTIDFQQYSFQWASIICLLISAPFFLKKDIDISLKLFKYSIYAVIGYGLFILIAFIKELFEGNIDLNKYHMIDPDFSNVAGTLALSFLSHPVASPILKKNINPKNNERDLMWGYVLTACIYSFVGFLGGLSCASQVENIYDNQAEYSILFDCYKSVDTLEQKIFFIVGKVIQTGIFYQNYTVLPIIVFITRKEFLDLLNTPRNNKVFYSFTILFMIMAAMMSILPIDVSYVMSFDGAIVGFFMIYGIPIYMHLKCYYHKFTSTENDKRLSLLSSSDPALNQLDNISAEIENKLLDCNPHKPKNKVLHFIWYGLIIVFGIALGVFKIYSFINS